MAIFHSQRTNFSEERWALRLQSYPPSNPDSPRHLHVPSGPGTSSLPLWSIGVSLYLSLYFSLFTSLYSLSLSEYRNYISYFYPNTLLNTFYNAGWQYMRDNLVCFVANDNICKVTISNWRQNRPKGDDLCYDYECRLNCRRLLYVFRNLIKITLLLLLSLVSRPTKTINDEREEGANF